MTTSTPVRPRRLNFEAEPNMARQVENIPIQVGKFFIPIDFVMIEMEDTKTPLLLSCPFLAIAGGAMIDVKNGRY